MYILFDNERKNKVSLKDRGLGKKTNNSVIEEEENEESWGSEDDDEIKGVEKQNLISLNSKKYQVMSKEHKPGNEEERERIIFYGGSVHKHPNKQNLSGTPFRLWGSGNDSWGPGLAVSRSFGDRMAQQYGLICEP